jgi:ABC-type glycerol-3-phosphate transport system substrate-binding protein
MRYLCVCLFILLLGATSPLHAQTEPLIIQVWWGDGLYDTRDQQLTDLLRSQVDSFNRSSPQFRVELRIKPSQGNGSILNTLSTGQPVAPSALPHLILLPHHDLDRAAQLGLVQDLEAWIPDTLRESLLPSALLLGRSRGLQYGLPYALVIQHLIYRSSAFSEPPLTFPAVLSGDLPFWLPSGTAPNGIVNGVVLAQYLQAGGRLSDETNKPTLDAEPLTIILNFYEQGLARAVFTANLLNYQNSRDYANLLGQNRAGLAILDSTTYLNLRELLNAYLPAPLPTADGSGPLVLEGWVWALTTANPDLQSGALEFVEWMMRPDQQAVYSEGLGVLPSQRSALRLWADEDYTRLILNWLEHHPLIVEVVENSNAAAQLQAAFIAVLNGTPTDEAVRNALAALSP